MARHCIVCGKRAYSDYCVRHKPRKRIPQQSTKEINYQAWKETVVRPQVIARDGNICQCCKRPARIGEKLDLDHKLNKGSRPDMKRDINNLQLLCRTPCHYNKTNNVACIH